MTSLEIPRNELQDPRAEHSKKKSQCQYHHDEQFAETVELDSLTDQQFAEEAEFLDEQQFHEVQKQDVDPQCLGNQQFDEEGQVLDDEQSYEVHKQDVEPDCLGNEQVLDDEQVHKAPKKKRHDDVKVAKPHIQKAQKKKKQVQKGAKQHVLQGEKKKQVKKGAKQHVQQGAKASKKKHDAPQKKQKGIDVLWEATTTKHGTKQKLQACSIVGQRVTSSTDVGGRNAISEPYCVCRCEVIISQIIIAFAGVE